MVNNIQNMALKKHKGYVTKAHKEALEKYGVTPIHRKSLRQYKSTE